MTAAPARRKANEDLQLLGAGQPVQFRFSSMDRNNEPDLLEEGGRWPAPPAWWRLIRRPVHHASDEARRAGNVFPREPKIGVPSTAAGPARIAELEHVVWEQSLALISRYTQLADLCNKHQQQTDELNVAYGAIRRLNDLEAKARGDGDEVAARAQRRIAVLEDELEAERQKTREAISACSDSQKQLLAAETKLNDAHVLAVMASERAVACQGEREITIEELVRLKEEVGLQSKAHREEVNRIRAFHIACISELRELRRPVNPEDSVPATDSLSDAPTAERGLFCDSSQLRRP
jgi:hypothetical protein